MAAAAPSSSSSSSWQRLLESGVFESSYGQRVGACFRHLCPTGADSFALRDLTERGKFVFAYLSISASQDTSFAVMDIFRQLDRSGTGKVRLEDFVVGIVQHLLSLVGDSKRTDEIAHELWQQLAPTGITGSIISALEDDDDDDDDEEGEQEEEDSAKQKQQEKQQQSSKLQRCPLFCANMLAMKYRIRENLQQNFPSRGLTRANLSQVLVSSLEEVVVEILGHFHLSTARLGEILSEDAMYAHGSSAGGKGHHHSDPLGDRLKALGAARTRLQAAPLVWQPTTTGHAAAAAATAALSSSAASASSATSVAAAALAGVNPALLTPSMRRVSIIATGSGAVRRGLLKGPDAGHEGADSSASSSSATAASAHSKREALRASISQALFRRSDADGDERSRASVDAFVGYLGALGLGENDADAALGSLDASEVFLLQTAYKSLDSFFSLLTDEAGAAASRSKDEESGGGALEAEKLKKKKIRAEGLRQLTQGMEDDEEADAVSADPGMGHDVGDRKYTRTLAESVLPAKTPHSSSQSSSSSSSSMGKNAGRDARKAAHSVEAELAQSLTETQDELRRARVRLEILEIVQSHAAVQAQAQAHAHARSSVKSKAELEQEVNGTTTGVEPTPEANHPPRTLTPTNIPVPGDSPSRGRAASSAQRLFAGLAIGGSSLDDKPEAGAAAPSTDKGKEKESVFASPASATTASPAPSFEEIMGELVGIKALLATRGTPSSALGRLLSAPAAIMPLTGDGAAKPDIQALDELAGRLHETLRRVRIDDELQANLAQALRVAEEKEAELKASNERIEPERTKHMSTEIELQMSLEELKRLQVENVNARVWSKSLDHCQIQLLERENELRKYEREIAQLRHDLEYSGSQTHHMEENFKLKTVVEQLRLDKEKVLKENNRLENSFRTANKKLYGALHGNQELQKLQHATEDELEESRAQIQRLFRTIKEMTVQTSQLEETRRRVDLLQNQLDDRDRELNACRSEVELVHALKRETEDDKTTISQLANDLAEMRIQVDLAEPLKRNLEEERAKLRATAKEMNEIKTAKHELQFKLADLMQIEERNLQLTLDVQEYKVKVEKLPSLIGDLAKVKALSKASQHSLREQDRALEELKKEKKKLEKENNALRLEQDRRKDSDAKLRALEEDLVKNYIPLKGENARLREELDRLKADKVETAGRWNKLRSVIKSDEAKGSISPQFLKAVRKSLPDDAARREERRREEKEKDMSPRVVEEIGESVAVDEE